jgi:putative chitinase
MTLRVGSRGNEVRLLQEKLGISADGNFGPGTERALRAWQTRNGLTADGIAGPRTLTALGVITNTSTQPVAAPSAAPSAAPISIQTNSSIVSTLKLDKLKGHVPDRVLNEVVEIAERFEITTPLRLAHFLAQCGHESGGFRAVQENLNYSAKGLMGIFGKYFPTEQLAMQYQRNPELIASRVYGGRMGNGPEPTREGFKFRGRGYLQTTGKNNYMEFGRFIGEDLISNPDLVATKYPLASAAFFFHTNRLWAICDEGATDAVVTKVTRRVNGGVHGLSDRIKHFKEYYNLMMSI